MPDKLDCSENTPSTPQETFKLGHRLELDGIRGIAILIVVLGHFGLPVLPQIGVDLFFVLSGFLITSLLLEEWMRSQKIDFKGFYKRRALRLLPALFLFIIACIVFAPMSEIFSKWVSEVWWVLTYLTNIGIILEKVRLNGVFAICWSLAIEEQFYIVWPVALFWILRKRLMRALPRYLSALILLIVGWSWVLILQGASAHRIYYGTDTHGHLLFMGCLLASMSYTRKKPSLERSLPVWAQDLLILGVLFAVLSYQASFKFYVLGMTVYGGLLTLVVWGAVNCRSGLAGKIFRWPVLIMFGKISYGLYLYHAPIYLLVYPVRSDPMYQIGGIALSVSLACLSYYGIERHFLKLK